MKKFLSRMLTVVLLVCICSVGLFGITASAEEKHTEGYYTYTVENGVATIVSADKSIYGDIIIPSTLGGYPVQTIGISAFWWNDNLTKVTIPNTVTKIGEHSFEHCSNLTEIEIADSVKQIGDAAFWNCSNLSKINIPPSVESIGGAAFRGCESITEIIIPKSATKIKGAAFDECSFLENVYIEDIAAWYKIDFDDTVSNPLCNGANLYLNGNLVEDLIVPENITRISDNAFYGCNSIKTITIPDSVVRIGRDAFSVFNDLREVKIGKGIETLEYHTFAVQNIDNLIINPTLKTMDANAFGNCKIEKVTFNGTLSEWEEMPYTQNKAFAKAEIVCVVENTKNVNSNMLWIIIAIAAVVVVSGGVTAIILIKKGKAKVAE